MTEQEIENELREIAKDVEFKDVLAAPKEHKQVNFDLQKLAVEKAEKVIFNRKEEQRMRSVLAEAEQEESEEQEEGEEYETEEDFSDVEATPEESAKAYLIYFKLGLKALDAVLPKKEVDLMPEEDMDHAEYLSKFDRKDLDKDEQKLIGRYNRLKNQKSESEAQTLTKEEEREALEALKLICRKRKWKASPEAVAITALGQIIAVRVLPRVF
jgi:hypothetical protein